MDLTDIARKVFVDDNYARLTGVEIVSVHDGEVVCSLALNERHRNARGVAMGGVLFTLADFAAAVAANSETLEELQWVSLDSDIHFLTPATGDTLKATCRALKQGCTTALYQTIIESLDNGKRVAIVETRMIRV